MREALLAHARKVGGEKRDWGEKWERNEDESGQQYGHGGVWKVLSSFQNDISICLCLSVFIPRSHKIHKYEFCVHRSVFRSKI